VLTPLIRDAALSLDWRLSDPVERLERPVRASPRVAVDGFEQLRELLDAIPNAGGLELGYDEWFRVVAAIHHETGGSADGLQLAHEFSARATGKYEPEFLDQRVWPFIRSDGRDAVVGMGTVRRLASSYGWHEVLDENLFDDLSLTGVDDQPPAPQESVRQATQTGLAQVNRHAPDVQTSKVTPLPVVASMTPGGGAPLAPVKRRGIPEAHHLTTDQANANRLVNAFGRQVLVAAGRWHVWDGKRWAADEADVYRYGCMLSDLIRAEASTVLAKASLLGDLAAKVKAQGVAEALGKWAQRSEMKATIEAAIGLAKKMLTVDESLLDRDPFALNCLNGIVDLRTGIVRKHDPDELITKLVGVKYVVEAVCPVWDRVLLQITREEGSATPIAAYLQRWFGYCLTGSVIEQVFVVHWGSGSNGKSTVLGVMAETMGDYASTAPPGLMAQSKSDRHPTEIAALMGRRMVTSHESSEGVVLREDFIKQATGDDRLEARFMRGDFFGFEPTHKLQLLTNHKPQVKGTDPGIWRRVQLVPYLASFGTEGQVLAGTHTGVRDVGLVERLRSELEGILAWRVRGAVEWAAGGLQPPSAVLVASEAYKQEQDRVGQFVAECCERDVGAMEPLTDGMGGLYPAFVSWCKDGGVYPMSKVKFADEVLRVVGVGATIERRVPNDSGRRRNLAMVPGLRLLAE
jgi:putative DNA primase/helicase